jgi:hypothetical protein
MPIDFPSSPTTGQVYTYLGKSWVYNGTGWDVPKALSEIGAVRSFANATARTAAIPSPTEGIVTYLNDVDRLDVHNGSAFVPALSIGAWTAFTPTWVAGLTVGNGVYNTSHYTLVGKTVHFAIDFTLGTTSAVTGQLILDMPVELSRKNIGTTGMFYCTFSDTGVATIPGFATASTTSSNRFLVRYLVTAAGTNPINLNVGLVSATAPFTWAATDKIIFSGTYEVA